MGMGGRFSTVVKAARRGEEGFTIIEILVAAFILVLASLAVFMAFASAVISRISPYMSLRWSEPG